MTSPLLMELGQTVLVGSGAMGTSLRKPAEAVGGFVELLNLRSPESVRALHERYRQAGSRILVTNTFAANPVHLAAAGQAAQCGEINQTGVRLARQVAGADCMVWASIGPLSIGLSHDDYSDADLVRLYAEQCGNLEGADAILMETFTDLREARAAFEAACPLGLPLVFQIGNVGGGRDKWRRIQTLMELALSRGVAAVGTNCRHPNEIIEVAAFLAAHAGVPVTASANAGHPIIDRGSLRYEFSPSDFTAVAMELADKGVSVIGGCCGTTPEHIRAVQTALGTRPVRTASRAGVTTESAGTGSASARKTNPVRALMQSDRFLISVEIRADRKRDLTAIVEGAREIAEAGADLFDVPDNPGATVGRDAVVTASRLQSELNILSICHRSAIQSNLLRIHSDLIGCWDLGVHGVLAITGDVPGMGHLGGLTRPVSDLKSSVELLRLIRTLRTGQMINGEEVADAPDFCAGCAFGAPVQAQFSWLRKKMEAGAEFAFTQPVFSLESYRQIAEGVAGMPVRLFPGVMPLTGKKNVESLASGRIPGIRIPEGCAEAFAGFSSAAEERRYGLEQATALAVAIARESRGIYLIMPFGKSCYSDTAAIVRAIRAVRPQ